jgi:ornithine cyclodeaminase/alanine dehydrogenase-like protein (mu-crystallin family)
MVRVIRDHEFSGKVDIPKLVARLEDGYRADGSGDVVTFPRRRFEARGTTLAWLGAALPSEDLLAYRSYLYGPEGVDRGHQVVALYGHSRMELRALFVGRLVGGLRTGAAVAAALHLVNPEFRDIGLIGTGHQARNTLACLVATFRPSHVVAWSPNPDHREAFRKWARSAHDVDIDLVETAADVLRLTSGIALLTASEHPVVTAEMLSEPKLLLSISAYRRPEIDPLVLDSVRFVWTDSVEQASGPGSLFEGDYRKSKLRPLSHGLEDGSLRDASSTRIIINTGAAWEEALTAQGLFELAVSRGIGTELELREGSAANGVF